jgi:hypothetical protein
MAAVSVRRTSMQTQRSHVSGRSTATANCNVAAIFDVETGQGLAETARPGSLKSSSFV